MALQIITALVLLAIILKLRRRDTSRSLPPGPKPLPVIGNILDLPREKAWLGYHEMSKQYGAFFVNVLGLASAADSESPGDVMFLQIPMQPILVIDSAQAATDLLEKRSHLYSDRLQLLMPKLCVILPRCRS